MAASRSAAPAIGVALLLAVTAWIGWTIWNADPPLARSVIGTAGLRLAIDDIRLVDRRVPLTEDPVLRVLPLYDNDVVATENKSGLSPDLEQEISRTGFLDIRTAPTLVVLTKWRRGALSHATFHPAYLVDPSTVRVPLVGGGIRLAQAEPAYETFTPGGRFARPVTLYAAQTMAIPVDHDACTPVLWRGARRFGAVLVARCVFGGTTFHVLSDPDLVNNHGLGVGENAVFARAMVTALAGKPTPPPPSPPSPRNAPRPRDTSFETLWRLLQGPFALFWMALGLLAALALWRGGVRFGRADDGTNDGAEGFIEPSRMSMIEADARLLRASGAVRPLLRAHGEQRLRALARRVFGRGATPETLLRALDRRAPQKAQALRDLTARVTPSHMAQPRGWLARFDRAVNEAAEEFDR